MSLDSQYIIQYEGPFPKNYLEEKVKEFQDELPCFEAFVFGYDTVAIETKHCPDDRVIKLAKKHGDAIQVVARNEQGRWREIYGFK